MLGSSRPQASAAKIHFFPQYCADLNRMNYTCIENVSLMYYEQKQKALQEPFGGEKYRYIRLGVLRVLPV